MWFYLESGVFFRSLSKELQIRFILCDGLPQAGRCPCEWVDIYFSSAVLVTVLGKANHKAIVYLCCKPVLAKLLVHNPPASEARVSAPLTGQEMGNEAT